MTYDGDLLLAMTEDGADIGCAAGQPAMDAGLSTAVLLSLWTLPGWWGDVVSEPGERGGSDLESLMAGTVSVQTMLDAEEAARKALAWLVTAGIASRVTVSGSIPRADIVYLTITIEQPAGGEASLRYSLNWAAQSARLEALT